MTELAPGAQSRIGGGGHDGLMPTAGRTCRASGSGWAWTGPCWLRAEGKDEKGFLAPVRRVRRAALAKAAKPGWHLAGRLRGRGDAL